VEEVRYQCSDGVRRQIWLMTVFAPPLVALAVSAIFSTKGGFTFTKMAILAPIVWALMMPIVIRVSGRTLGSTTVSAAGLRTRTLVTERAIRWDEVTALKVYAITGQAGTIGHVLQAHRKKGQPLDLPGVYSSSSRRDDPEFVAKVEAICSAWVSATGRNELPRS
jgi:hypothetical protein